MLYVILKSRTSLVQQIHEAFFIFISILLLWPDLLTQISLKLFNQAHQGILGFLTDSSLQTDHLLNAICFTLQPLSDLGEVILANDSLLVYLSRDLGYKVLKLTAVAHFVLLPILLDLCQFQRQLEVSFVYFLQICTWHFFSCLYHTEAKTISSEDTYMNTKR